MVNFYGVLTPSTFNYLKIAVRDFDAVTWLKHITLCVAIATFLAWMLVSGIRYRISLYEQSKYIRYQGDVRNAYRWGTLANEAGIVSLYDRIAAKHADDAEPNYDLDYPPLRLTAATLWVRWTRAAAPQVNDWQPEYPFTSPMLCLNTLAQAMAAVMACGLIRHWILRSTSVSHIPLPIRAFAAIGLPAAGLLATYRPYRGFGLGLLGGTLLWWNPGLLWDGYCFVQWDSWIVPFFLAAAWAASADRWFLAGLLIGSGAMVKGQMLLGAPVLVLWALFSMRPGMLGRLLVGVITSVAVITSPWMLRGLPAACWLVAMGAACAGLCIVRAIIGREGSWPSSLSPARRRGLALAAVATFVIPAAIAFGRCGIVAQLVAIIGASAVGACGLLLPRRALPYFVTGVLACGVFLCIPLFDGSDSWLRVGLAYGARKFAPLMATEGTTNLPRILQARFGWKSPLDVMTIDLPLLGQTSLAIKSILTAAYVMAMIVCGWAAAVHARRNDPRVLVAIVAPWVLFFVLLPQMHSRYLVWGASFSCVFVAFGAGMTLVHAVLSIACWSMIAYQLLRFDKTYWPEAQRFVSGLNVDFGWALLAIAILLLYIAWPSRPRFD